MNKTALMICMSVLVGTMQANAQSWLEKIGDRVKEKAIEKVEDRIESRADDAVDKGLNKTEDTIKKSGKKKSTTQTSKESNENEANESSGTTQSPRSKADVSYLKYDFVAGNEVIFEDDLKGETKGEFPSKWDLLEGGSEIAQINGENVIALVGYTYVTPLFKSPKDKYLPDEFTLEFDVFLNEVNGEFALEFVNNSDETVANMHFWKESERFLFEWNMTDQGGKNGEDTYDNSPGWHHFALSFNKRAMKMYMDSKRVANIPNVTVKPSKVKFFARGDEDKSAFHIKNIRLAKGAVPLYDKLLADGKIITYGITFDVGKATIKPQSMGVINEICQMLKNHPDLKFSIEGHTDNTGNATSNQTLSEARAKAVCAKLTDMGIDAGRLSAKGQGMNKPIGSNDTAEGRAKNRRVEFVKM